MEEQLTALSRELVRTLHQDSLDLRTVREKRRGRVTGSDQVARGIVEQGHDRGLATVFGEVTVTRMAYRRRGVPNLYPADAVLNLPVVKHSHGLARLAAIEAPRGSFDAGHRGHHPRHRRPDRQTPARAARGRRRGRRGRVLRRAPARARRQRCAAGDVLRRERHRDAPRSAARGHRQGGGGHPAQAGHPAVPGEKNGRKRMAELGCVYDCAPVPRTAADIIARPAKDPARPRPPAAAPAAAGKWLTSSITSDIPAVITAGFAEAHRRDPARERTWIALVDGNRTQIEAIEAEAARRGVQVTILIDFIHVLEYCWKAAWSFFEPGDPDAETWVAAQATKILDGKAAQVAAGIRRRATTYGYSGKEREGADACAGYLTAKAPYLGYAHALASGWPIATGIIEGACRHIVKDRMDITGARWGLDGAEAILKLRALHSNGDFDAYWEWHLDQEQRHVHYARYQDPSALAA